jgi:3'-phosphoadenosine 5'-phosphosulfate sulfotransferase (PAPS reductase)/FAD synthetase
VSPLERKAFAAYARTTGQRRKEEQALAVIREALTLGASHVACSWGKDSVALLHLVQTIAPDIPVFHLRTPLQDMLDNYTEVQHGYCAQFPTVYHEIMIEEGKTIPTVVKDLALWQDYPVALIGIRAEENRRTRGIAIAKYGLVHRYQSGPNRGSVRAFPLGYWTWQHVWAYTVAHDLPYLASYDHPAAGTKARSRTTNVMPFGDHFGTSRRYGRIAQIRQIAPEAFRHLQTHYPHIAAFT